MISISFLAKHRGQTLRSSMLNLELADCCCDAVAILVGHGLESGGGEEDVWSVVLLLRMPLETTITGYSPKLDFIDASVNGHNSRLLKLSPSWHFCLVIHFPQINAEKRCSWDFLALVLD